MQPGVRAHRWTAADLDAICLTGAGRRGQHGRMKVKLPNPSGAQPTGGASMSPQRRSAGFAPPMSDEKAVGGLRGRAIGQEIVQRRRIDPGYGELVAIVRAGRPSLSMAAHEAA